MKITVLSGSWDEQGEDMHVYSAAFKYTQKNWHYGHIYDFIHEIMIHIKFLVGRKNTIP